jgi:hypothetical protein
MSAWIHEVRILVIYMDHCVMRYVFHCTLTESRNNMCFSASRSLQCVVSYCLQHGPIDSTTSVDTGVHRTQTRVFTEPCINWSRSLPNDSICIEVVVPVLEMLVCRYNSCLLQQYGDVEVLE